MKAYRPSAHRDADTSRRRSPTTSHAGPTSRHNYSFNRKSCTKAKLSDDQIRWVRANWNQSPGGTMTIAAMARELNVGSSTIGSICRGNTWKDVK